MELIFNELSSIPESDNKALANQKVAEFIKCFAVGVEYDFNRIRFDKQFHEIQLADQYTLESWLNETDNRNFKNLILGARTYPCIDPQDTWAEEEYVLNHFYYENTDFGIARIGCLGLAVARIYNTLSIGFSETSPWRSNNINIIKIDEEKMPEAINIVNVYSEECFGKENVIAFIQEIANVVLIESNLDPLQKNIHLRDDHGYDTLFHFARRLINSPYVVQIINSLPYNNRITRFIRNAYPTGLIEIVLYWTDSGYGMVVQTTGTNQRETDEIARILEEQYGQ